MADPAPDPSHARAYLVFRRYAREAAHQLLFFTGLLLDTGVPALDRRLLAAAPDTLATVKAIVLGVGWDPEAELHDGWRRWKALRDRVLGLATLDGPTAASLITACKEFLGFTRAGSGPSTGWWRALAAIWREHTVADAGRYLRAHTAFASGLAVGALLCATVEPVRAMLIEGWRWTLVCAVVLLAMPSLGAWFWRRRAARAGRVPAWDVGGRPFRAIAPQAHAPDPAMPRYAPGSTLPDALLRSAARRMGWLAVPWTTLLLASAFSPPGDLTVFGVFTILYALAFVGHLVDFWDYFDPRPIRLVALGFGGLLVIATDFSVAPAILIAVLGGAGAWHALLFFLNEKRRLYRLYFAGGFLLLAAAAWQKGVTTDRETWREPVSSARSPWRRVGFIEWPKPGSGPVVVLAASGGGSRAAIYTALTLEALHADPELARAACALQAMSSVSGGSLATAAYVARRAEHPDLCNSLRDPSQVALHLVDGVDDNFILPTMRGVIERGSRGAAIERYWRERNPGLGERSLSNLAHEWLTTVAAEPPPLPLFNSATLDGHDVVISPLAALHYVPRSQREEAVRAGDAHDRSGNQYDIVAAKLGEAPTWVHYRGIPYGLEELIGDYDPQLASAVRASANFPFGFPLVRVDIARAQSYSPWPARRRPIPGAISTAYLTDGGVLSNSGLWSLYHLLVNHADVLRSRGVLLLIVEASRMPSVPSRLLTLSGLWSAIGEAAPVARNLHERMLDALFALYGDGLAVAQIDLPAIERTNLMTTWALPGRYRETLRAAFTASWQEARPCLAAEWRRLAIGPRTTWPAGCRRIPARPPLD